MKSTARSAAIVVLAACTGVAVSGCTPVFNSRAAHEISKDKLLALADRDHTDHVHYMGSDGKWHYVFDSRSGRAASYKVRADQIKLKDTFNVGDDDAYVLWPWMIEGERLGTRPSEMHAPQWKRPNSGPASDSQVPSAGVERGKSVETPPTSRTAALPVPVED